MSYMELTHLTETEDTLKGKYLIYTMADEQFGIEIRYITEIIGIQPITPIPGLPEYIMGVTNLRGKIIPVMDARLRFRKEPRDYDDRTCIIVLDTDEMAVGLIVDSVLEVIALPDEEIAPPPELRKGATQFIKGIGKSDGHVKLLLDCRKLLSEEEVEALEAAI